jgi:hypothetical protein
LPEFDDDWRDLPRTPKVDAWITRPAEPWGTREAEPEREFKRGRPMTEREYAGFRSRGGEIDYCVERLAKQKLNDDRYSERKNLRPLGGGSD